MSYCNVQKHIIKIIPAIVAKGHEPLREKRKTKSNEQDQSSVLTPCILASKRINISKIEMERKIEATCGERERKEWGNRVSDRSLCSAQAKQMPIVHYRILLISAKGVRTIADLSPRRLLNLNTHD